MKTSRLAALAGSRAAVPVLALALTLSACGGSGEDDTQDAGAGTSTASFPITVEHKFGSTEIEAEPKRIVTVGLTDQDAVLAMGTVPVAVTNWFGEAEGRIFAWATDDLEAATNNPLGDGELPEVLDSEKEFEKVAALRPDLITAVYAGITQQDYEKLSKIAPVVAAPKNPDTGEAYVDYGTPWQEATVIIGTALGHREKAEKAVADVGAQLDQVKEDHPEFAGKAAATVAAYEGIFVYGNQDPRGRFLTDIGFTFPANLERFSAENFGESISAENASEVDLDVLVWVNGAEATHEMVPTYRNLRVAKEGRDVFIAEDDEIYIASSFVTVLSLPFIIAKEVPRLVAAVDGDPATPTGPTG